MRQAYLKRCKQLLENSLSLVRREQVQQQKNVIDEVEFQENKRPAHDKTGGDDRSI